MADEFGNFTKDDFDKIAKIGNPVERGNAYLEAKQYQKAIDSYSEASTSGTDDVTFNIHLGEAYLGATFYDEARQVFEDVLKVTPDDPEVLKYLDHLSGEKQHGRGQRAMEKEEYEEAIINFEEALELNQKNTLAHMGLASAYLEMGELDKTIELIETLYGVERGELDEYVLLVNRLAIYLRREERYDDAIGVYGIALEADPEDPALYFNLAMSHLKKDEKAHAKIHLRQAIHIDPNFQEAKDLLNELSGK